MTIRLLFFTHKACIAGLLVLVLMLAACQVAPAPSAAEPNVVSPAATLAATPAAAFTPTASSAAAAPTPALSVNPYEPPSKAYAITFPQNWTCEEQDDEGVGCWSADAQARITVRVIATGYELLQEHFEALANAELVQAYAGQSAYSQESLEANEGQVLVNSVWREEDIMRMALDSFQRSGAGVLHISLSAQQDSWQRYQPLYEAVLASVQGRPEQFFGMPLYAHRREYVSPGVLFMLELPTSWTRYVDTASIIRTRVEGVISPDMRAAVQVAVYSKNSVMEQQDRIPVTQDIMRSLYGADVRISHYKALPDGRERMEWRAERRGVSGISYNGTYGFSLYVFSVVWDDTAGDMYLPVLQQVLDSFSLP